MWKVIEANSNLIQTSTTKAVLIKCPKTDWLFWHPAKCVKTFGKNNYLMSISFTEEFKFKLFKNGNGKYNSFEKIDEKEISSEEIVRMFS